MDISAYQDKVMENAQELLGIDSPSGFTQAAAAFLDGFAARLGYETTQTNKGNVIVHIPGRESGKKVALCSHVDTLGLMVRSITADGQLKITRVGGPILPTLDGEYCAIYTRDGRRYTGTVLYVSHDRYFINKTATRILELTGQTLINYIGNYDYYLEKKEELTRIHLGDSQTAATAAVSTADTEAKLDWKQQKEEQARLRKIQNDLKKTETEIERLESREAEIDELMTQESVFTNVAECIKLNKEKEEIAEQLLSLMEQWEELSEQAAQ